MAIFFQRTPRVLLLYKRSSFLSNRKAASRLSIDRRFRQNHLNHYASLAVVEDVLKRRELSYRKRCRGKDIDYASFDLVVSVGGDGTFLEAARNLGRHQIILGVNSDPAWSVGQFCACDSVGFEKILLKMLKGSSRIKRLYKLRVVIGPTGKNRVDCLNDILVCHANPAAMSRYEMRLNGVTEEQRSSGIWFSTAAGSTGAILSAGGKTMPIESRVIQYRPRELYHVNGHYRFQGGSFRPGTAAVVISRMAYGRIFVDGAHIRLPFTYGQKVRISSSPEFVRAIHD